VTTNGDGGRTALTVHILRVTLLDVSPPVWRLIRVPSAITLGGLHVIVQTAMGWEDRHLHEWRIGDRSFGPPDEEDWGEGMDDESTALLADVAPADSILRYDYDLGDGWEHLVEVEAVEPYDATVPPVAVLDGARAAPPEDCGGPPGYEHLLDALSDPSDPEHDEMVAWVGDRFDPEEFDRAATNRRLEPLWRPAV
jgi:hypothetical protein